MKLPLRPFPILAALAGVTRVDAWQPMYPFTLATGTQQITGGLAWTGGPAIDLDLHLVDPAGNLVASGATATSDPEHAVYVTPDPGTYQWKVVAYDNPNPMLA